MGVRLYFDLLRFLFGISILGLACHVPSFMASILYVDSGGYAASKGYVPSWPTVLNLLSIGARAQELDAGYGAIAGCPKTSAAWSTCELLNTLTALLDVAFTLFFFLCLLRFERYARGLDMIDRGENVFIAEYTVALYGLKGAKEVSSAEMKEHVESALKEHAKAMLTKKREKHRYTMWQAFLDGDCHEVVDVTMIANDRKVLKGLLDMAAAEAKVPLLQSKKMFMKAVGKSDRALAKMDKKVEKAKKTRDEERDTLAKRATEPFHPVGAIITFNKEEAVGPAKEVFDKGWQLFCCPPAKEKYARITTSDGKRRRLKAYALPSPQDIRYENLYARFDSSTACRRSTANLLLGLIILFGMIVTLVGVFAKDSADVVSRVVAKVIGEAIASATASATATAGLVDAGSGLDLGNLTLTNSTAVTGGGAQCSAADQAIVDTQLSELSYDKVLELYNKLMSAVSTPPDQMTLAQAADLSQLMALLIAILNCFATPLFNTVVTVVTVALNQLIGWVISSLQEFSRYSSLSEMHTSEIVKLAATTFINTAVIQLIVYQANGPTVDTLGLVRKDWLCFVPDEATANAGAASELASSYRCLFGPKGILMRGSHFDASPRWYTDVGANFMNVMIVQMLTRALNSIRGNLVFMLKRFLMLGRQKTMEAAQATITGPDLELPGRIGQLYAFVAVCLLFSSGMPLMFAVIALYAFACYFIDKWTLVKVCKMPIPYSFQIINSTVWWIKYILIGKLVFAWWCFGSLPGIPLNTVMSAVTGDANVAAEADPTALMASLGDSYLSARIATVGSVILFLGAVLMLLILVAVVVAGRLPSFVFAMCECGLLGCHTEAPSIAYNPPFMDCIGKYADVPGCKTKPNGTIVLDSQVIPKATCLNCYGKQSMGPHTLMLYLCGIEVQRGKISQAAFDKLPNKKATISGQSNMTYGPFFMPQYEEAFRFSHEGVPLPPAAEQEKEAVAVEEEPHRKSSDPHTLLQVV